MKFAIRNLYALFAIFSLAIIPVQMTLAGKYYTRAQNQPFNLTQNIEEGQSFELSQGQIKSRIEHKLVNFLLGNAVDQYLDFGPDDDIAQKSSQRLKIRVDEHQLFFIYQRQFK